MRLEPSQPDVQKFRKWEKDNRKSHPHYAESRAYLSEQVERDSAVIPNTHAEYDIEDDAEDKLNSSDSNGAYYRFQSQRQGAKPLRHYRKHNEGKSARYQHAPMSMSPPEYLNKSVSDTADDEKQSVFF